MSAFSISTCHSSFFPFQSEDIPGVELKACSIQSFLCGARCPSRSVPPAFLAPSLTPCRHWWPHSPSRLFPHSPGSAGLLWSGAQVGWEGGRCLIPNYMVQNYGDIWENSCCFDRRKSNSHTYLFKSECAAPLLRRREVQVHCCINMSFAIFSSFFDG